MPLDSTTPDLVRLLAEVRLEPARLIMVLDELQSRANHGDRVAAAFVEANEKAAAAAGN